jgi:hypothetical protein
MNFNWLSATGTGCVLAAILSTVTVDRSRIRTAFRRSLLELFKLLMFAQVNSVNSALQPASLFQILIGQLLGSRQLSVDLGALLVEFGVIPIFGNKL